MQGLTGIEAAVAEIEDRKKEYNRLLTQLEATEAKLAEAVKVIEFYANSEWNDDYPGGVFLADNYSVEFGDRAREFLQKYRKDALNEMVAMNQEAGLYDRKDGE